MQELLTSFAPFFIVGVVFFSVYFMFTERFSTERITLSSIGLFSLYIGFMSKDPFIILDDIFNRSVISIISIIALGRLVACTGIINRLIFTLSKTKHKALIPISMILVSYFASSFINNTPVVILLISAIAVFDSEFKKKSYKIMMPIAFAASLGGMLTIFGSSTNLLIYSKVLESGIKMGFFDFIYPGMVIGFFGVAYVLLMTFLLPFREPNNVSNHSERQKFFFLLRCEKNVKAIFSSVEVRAIRNILYNLNFGKNLVLKRVTIPSDSALANHRLRDVDLKSINTPGIGIATKSSDIKPGARIIVVQEEYAHKEDRGLWVPCESIAYILSSRNSRKVIISFFAAIASSLAFDIPIPLTSFAAVSFLVMTGAVSSKELFRCVEMKILLLLLYSLVAGKSLEIAGVLTIVASMFHQCVSGLPLWIVLASLFIVTNLLTEVMSNNAVGLMFTPVAIELSTKLGIETQYFIWAIIFATNSSFATPFGYQVNLLIMEQGGYKLSDYMRFGIALNLIVLLSYIGYLYFSGVDVFAPTL